MKTFLLGLNAGSWGILAAAVVASRISQRIADRRRAAA